MSAQDYGRTWWGRRWVNALEEAGQSWAERLPRGDEDVRRGRVSQLTVEPGRIGALVRGQRARAHHVALDVPAFGDEVWADIVARLAGRLRYTARLVAGEMPEDMDAIVEASGRSLFPRPDELAGSCDCDDDVVPCRHIAATHFAFAGELDRDPFLLLRLRGRDRATLLAELRGRRSGTSQEVAEAHVDEALRVEAEGFFDAQRDLDAIALHPERTDDPGALFDRLGPPPGVADPAPLVRLVGTAVDTAWKVAAGEGADVADDELLLAELRAHAVAGAGQVADALGWSVERTRDVLDRLWEEGTVLRTGSGEGARYRAT